MAALFAFTPVSSLDILSGPYHDSAMVSDVKGVAEAAFSGTRSRSSGLTSHPLRNSAWN